MDKLSERYGDLLRGSYDCVDRVVSNAYFSLGHNPGGFRVWWRRLHGDSDEHLDDTHLMRMAARFTCGGGVGAIDATARRPPVPYISAVDRLPARQPPAVQLFTGPAPALRHGGSCS